MKITKMHGAGNDFILINNIREKLALDGLPALAVKLCAYHTGVGADGMMVVEKSECADYRMIFYNNDGSPGEMCGNGSRCICRYGYEEGLAGETQRVETTAGIITGRRIDKRRYQVRLNDPFIVDFHRNAEGVDYTYVELGHPGLPQAIVRMDDWDEQDTASLRELGRTLRFAKEFPKGTNVTFVKKTGEDALKAVTFERGVEGFTLACGTGCGAAVTALTLMGEVSGKDVKVTMPGGLIEISLTAENGRVHDIFMTGSTARVFDTEIGELDPAAT